MLKKKVLILGASSDIGVEVAKKYFNENKYLLDLHYNNNFKALKNFKPNCKIIKSDFSKITFNNVLKKFRNE